MRFNTEITGQAPWGSDGAPTLHSVACRSGGAHRLASTRVDCGAADEICEGASIGRLKL